VKSLAIHLANIMRDNIGVFQTDRRTELILHSFICN